ncbi:hypothetical protein F5883DRAFT_707165 [Diaporthe sp. PMI_573]|nr:hypothetical protein F5883DRAFT_707165 [Diaporthaceae sp. PMI_573]
MFDPESEAIHTSPAAQTPPPQADLSALMAELGLGMPPRADMPPCADNIPGFNYEAASVNNPDDDKDLEPFPRLPDEANEELERLARWQKEKEMQDNNKYHRTVTISPLPDTATIADIFPRLRGGVDSCYISQFEETRIAVVTFKLPEDAMTYVEFCAETPIWSLWTFQISRPGVPFTWERRAKVELYKSAPGMGSAWDRADIPLQPRTVVAAGSRCLVYKECKPHEVAGIYRALGLHISQHQRDQVEGMWLDGPVRNHTGNPVYGSLHIWYTSIATAQAAKMRWGPLEYEYDPCSDSPPTLMLYLDEIEGNQVNIFRHYEPFVNLIDVNQKTILDGVLQGIVDPVQAYWRCLAPVRQWPDEGASLASRLKWSLLNHGGVGGQQVNMSGSATPTQRTMVLPTQMADPFIDSRPMGTGFTPQQSSQGTTTYTLGGPSQNILLGYPPFTSNGAVLPGHLSPTQSYVARTQERQALGFPPYSDANYGALSHRNMQPSRAITKKVIHGSDDTGGGGVIVHNAGSTNTNTNNNYSNLGGPNNPQSGRQPHPGSYDS